MTSVRYFPKSGLVLLKGRGITTTFHVNDRGNINHTLAWLGYDRVITWTNADTAFGSCCEGRTQRAKVNHMRAA